MVRRSSRAENRCDPPGSGVVVITRADHGPGPINRRLDLIAGVLQPTTARLLDQLGIKEGSRCLDVGCGGGHVVADLAQRVGPRGSVLGLDPDPTVLELAAQEVEGAGNVTLRQGDVRTLQGEGYDVVYARFLLIHLADVAEVLRRTAGCLTWPLACACPDPSR